MKNYLAISIGPVTEILLSARKTRELWAGSYLLSYIMREILKKTAKNHGNQILLPSPNLLSTASKDGAGLYPDRIYLEKGELEIADLITFKEETIKVLANQICDHFDQLKAIGKEVLVFVKPSDFTRSAIKDYLDSYLKIYILEVSLDPTLKESHNGIIKNISEACDTKDLANKVILDENIVDKDGLSPLSLFLFAVNHSFLYKDGFGKSKKRGFDSLIGVAARELKYVNDSLYHKILDSQEDNEDTLVEAFQEQFSKDFRDYHKYVAIVHADGDNIGQIINAIGDNSQQIKDFSNRLLEFASAATKEIEEYGGTPIYSGGDDLLFFAPLVIDKQTAERQSIFDLIHRIDQKFKLLIKDGYDPLITKNWKQKETEVKLPTMSYGMSITYYKFPLYESKNLSYEMLTDIKNHCKEEKEDCYAEKNAIKVAFQKHSGQKMVFQIPKNIKNGVDLWAIFTTLVNSSNNNDSFLNSFTYKLDLIKPLLTDIAQDKDRLRYFFKNNFNENYAGNTIFYQSLESFIHATATYYGDGIQTQFTKDAEKLLYSALRFIHFTQTKIKERDASLQD